MKMVHPKIRMDPITLLRNLEIQTKKKQTSQNSTEKIKNELKNSKGKITKQEIDDFRKTNLEKYKNDGDKSKYEFYKNATDSQLAQQIHSAKNAKAVLIAAGTVAGIGLGIFVAYKLHTKNVLASMNLETDSLNTKNAENIATAVHVSFDQMDDFVFKKVASFIGKWGLRISILVKSIKLCSQQLIQMILRLIK